MDNQNRYSRNSRAYQSSHAAGNEPYAYGAEQYQAQPAVNSVSPAGGNAYTAPNAPRNAAMDSEYSRDAAAGRYGKQRKSKNRKRVFAIVAVLVVALIAAGAGVAFAYYQSISGKLHQNVDQELRNALVEPAHADDPFYMLLMGVDGSEERAESDEYKGDTFRSDSMILCRIDPKNKKVTMISLHRDTMINMGSNGVQKLNAAHALGGPAYTVKVVSELAGVDIAHYAEINFDGFEAVVDALGGVQVDVPMDIVDDHVDVDIEAGFQTLNGIQALSLCRSRHSYDKVGDGDVYRAANQRLVLSAIAKKILDSDVGTMMKSIESISGYITTDFDLTTILSLANSMRGLDPSTDIYTAMEPTTSEYKNNTWYEKLNVSAWTTMMKRVNEGLPPTDETIVDATGSVLASNGDGSTAGKYTEGAQANTGGSSAAGVSGKVAVRNGTTTNGMAGKAADVVKGMGYTAEAGNADSSNYKSTLVIYSDSSQASDAEAIKNALGTGKTVLNDGSYKIPDGFKFLVVVGADYKG